MDDNYKILIIDDEEVVLDSCTEILRDSSYRVSTATNGDRGLELVDEVQPDVMVVDLKMPGISGFEVLERVQRSDPSIVSLVITGYATVGSAVEAMKRGAYDFLPKPFTPDEFRLIVRRAAEKRSLVLETMALRREREMLRENFAAIVSHEVKAPLGAIQQNLFLLERQLAETANEDQRRRLQRLRTRVDELLKLIDTWRRGISVDLETIRENFGPVNVATVIANAIETIAPHANRKGIELVTVATDEPDVTVRGDPCSLAEALVNILGNAVKYSHPNSQVTVSSEPRADSVLVTVVDTGVGIAPEDLPFIFDTFYSARSDDAGERGSGLGLAVSRRIIEAHDGLIAVDSELGNGSRFVIALPRCATVVAGAAARGDDVATTHQRKNPDD